MLPIKIMGDIIIAVIENIGAIIDSVGNAVSGVIDSIGGVWKVVGDVIVEVNREKITTVKSFSELINTIKNTGRTSLLLKIIRDNKSLWIAIKINN